MVVLDDSREAETYTKVFAHSMRDRGYTVPIQEGANNDIVDTTRARGGRAILLEFNEALLSTDRPPLVKAVAESLVISSEPVVYVQGLLSG